MNESFMRSLSDSEFLRHANPSTELERMLLERLESPQVEPDILEELREAAATAENEAEDLQSKLDDTEDELENLRDYAKNLHAALALAEPENKLLSDDDVELLKCK